MNRKHSLLTSMLIGLTFGAFQLRNTFEIKNSKEQDHGRIHGGGCNQPFGKNKRMAGESKARRKMAHKSRVAQLKKGNYRA